MLTTNLTLCAPFRGIPQKIPAMCPVSGLKSDVQAWSYGLCAGSFQSAVCLHLRTLRHARVHTFIVLKLDPQEVIYIGKHHRAITLPFYSVPLSLPLGWTVTASPLACKRPSATATTTFTESRGSHGSRFTLQLGL